MKTKKHTTPLLITLTALASILAFGAGCSKKADLSLGTVGETMAYDKTELKVKAGAEVTLTFKNNATSAAMEHNFVLTRPGQEQTVVMAAMAAGPTAGYMTDSSEIIAKTKLLKPGETDKITFKAPEMAGNYPFFCTFPGHFPMMKGVLVVE